MLSLPVEFASSRYTETSEFRTHLKRPRLEFWNALGQVRPDSRFLMEQTAQTFFDNRPSMCSGATYSWWGYANSLQQAIDKATY